MSSIPVFWGRGHTGYAPFVEVQAGRQIPGFDRVERIERITDELERRGGYSMSQPTPHGSPPILRVHSEPFVEFLEEASGRAGPGAEGLLFADTFLHEELRAGLPARTELGFAGRHGRYCFDTIAGVGPTTFAAAREAVDCGLTAVDALADGQRLAVALTRPPGHHAARELFGGGTYLNNAAIAAQALRDLGRGKVALLDLDVHHGNGSQSIFYRRADVLFVSVHVDPADHYPFLVGFADERGAEEGEGFNRNVPLPPGTQRGAYLKALQSGLDSISGFGAEALVVSLGVDAHRSDPASALALETTDFEAIGAAVAALGLPAIALLEGGYDLETLGANIAEWLSGYRDAASL